MTLRARSTVIEHGGIVLNADIAEPTVPQGLVLFAHGAGSSRLSPRNRAVAETLTDRGMVAVLLDLLTESEERTDAATREYRFDIPLLAERLAAATDWVATHGDYGDLRVGYFGASTGAAAALMAAAERPDSVSAVVSRGGRPDLAGDALARVQAPTLLIVGEQDPTVLDLNQKAAVRMEAPVQIEIIPGATHLFEESGALEEVARLAGEWFLRYLGG